MRRQTPPISAEKDAAVDVCVPAQGRHAGELAARCIRKTFVRAGQDPYVADTTAFDAHLEALMSNPTYGVLAKEAAAKQIEDKTLEAQMAQLQL